jgi:type I restriction enzyme S subunit
MRSNYKRLGNYIQVVNERNSNLEVERLLGVSIRKVLMPSIANTIGTNMTTYKIIKRNQFAYGPVTSRNGDKISIALLDEYDKAIVSQAYTVFEIIDDETLNVEYLMMWFRRPEFDRYARFKSHGSARETFDWEELEDTEIPIPSIEKQREIVKEYNTIVNRIKLNETLNQKLEDTAQALYKHWFVDFEFPNTEGKRYKSSGGEMVYNEELDLEIPEGWEVKAINELSKKITKGTTPKEMSDFKNELYSVTYLKGETIEDNHFFNVEKFSYVTAKTNETLLRSQIEENDICYSIAGSLDKFTLVDKEILPANTNQAIAIIRINNEIIPYEYIYGYFISQLQKEFYNYNVQQAVQANLSLTTIGGLPILIPSEKILELVTDFMNKWILRRNLLVFENRRLYKLRNLILSKMSKVESEKEMVK